MTIWADLERGKLTQFTSDVAIQNVGAQLDRKLEPIHLKTLRGRLSFQADQSDRWDFRAEKVGFVTDRGRRFGPTDITAACRTDEGARRSPAASARPASTSARWARSRARCRFRPTFSPSSGPPGLGRHQRPRRRGEGRLRRT